MIINPTSRISESDRIDCSANKCFISGRSYFKIHLNIILPCLLICVFLIYNSGDEEIGARVNLMEWGKINAHKIYSSIIAAQLIGGVVFFYQLQLQTYSDNLHLDRTSALAL